MKLLSILLILFSSVIFASSEDAIIENCKEILKTEKNDTNKKIYENCKNIINEKKLEEKKLEEKKLEEKKLEEKKLEKLKIKSKKKKIEVRKRLAQKKDYEIVVSLNSFFTVGFIFTKSILLGIMPKVDFIMGNIVIGGGIGYFGTSEGGKGGHFPSFHENIGAMINFGLDFSGKYYTFMILNEYYMAKNTKSNNDSVYHFVPTLAIVGGVKFFQTVDITGKIGLFTIGLNIGVHF